MNLADLHAKAMQVMAGFFTDFGSLPPVFLGLDREKNLHLLGAREFAEKRQFYLMSLRAYFVVHKIDAYAFAAEAWISTTSAKDTKIDEDGNLVPKLMPSDDPKRKEVLVVGAADRNDLIHSTFLIDRDQDGHATIGAPHHPSGVSPGTKAEYTRIGLFSLLSTTPFDGKEPLIKLVTDETVRRGYFKPYKIMKPIEYEVMTN